MLMGMTTQRAGTGQTMAAARHRERGWAAALAAGALLFAGCSSDFQPEPEMGPIAGPAPMPQQPLPEWEPPPCERDPATMPPPDGDELTRLAWGMAAHWRGKALTSFGVGPGATATFIVDVTFAPDGHYQAHSLMPGYAAFYYGSDEDVPAKTWSLESSSIPNDLGAIGNINIFFGPGNTQIGLLEGVLVSEDFSALRFRFTPMWLGVQPIVYDLRCEP